MARTRLVLAANQPLLLEAFSALLEPEFEVVARVTDGNALVAECARLKPDVAVAELDLRLLNPASTGRQLKTTSPTTRLLLLTGARDASGVGAGRDRAEFVEKTADAWELKRAIRASVKRGFEAPQDVHPEGLRPSGVEVPGLTPRQVEVLQLLAAGHSMKEVAAILDVTPSTVAFHKYKMMGQLQIRTTAELVQFAVKHGVLEG